MAVESGRPRQPHLKRSAGSGSLIRHPLGGPTLISQQPRCITVLSPLLSEMIPMTDKDMLFLAGLAGFAWWTYLFLPLVWFHS
jgi:hypothetical protein